MLYQKINFHYFLIYLNKKHQSQKAHDSKKGNLSQTQQLSYTDHFLFFCFQKIFDLTLYPNSNTTFHYQGTNHRFFDFSNILRYNCVLMRNFQYQPNNREFFQVDLNLHDLQQKQYNFFLKYQNRFLQIEKRVKYSLLNNKIFWLFSYVIVMLVPSQEKLKI